MVELLKLVWRVIQRNSTGNSFTERQYVPERELEKARFKYLFFHNGC